MKSWFASSLLWAGLARADSPEVAACLDASDLLCAEAAAADLPGDPLGKMMRGRLAYHRGEFAEALRWYGEAEAGLGGDDAFRREYAQAQSTAQAAQGFTVAERGDVAIRYMPGLDVVILDEAFETLQAAHDRTGRLLGGAPPGGVRMEIYPTGPRFIAASSLPAEAVRTTGVVALSKWTRVLLTSPRALGRGYAWRDTVAHEYIHYVVSWRSKDRTPVWLQEGIARALEAHWREDGEPALPPYQQGLLARALATDSFVPFEKMHPSFALLPSAEEAALAYAQVSTMVWTLQRAGGDGAISRVLDEIAAGVDALQAVADVAAGGDVEAFLEAWKEELRGRALVAKNLAAMPTVLGPAEDDFGIDPVLARRRDLAGKARLGDLLLAAGRADAALVEFRSALPADEPPSPVLAARIAQALRELGRAAEARSTLEASVVDYPEFALTQKMLGEAYLAEGRVAEAAARFRASADVNPFDPTVQRRLADLYPQLGQAELGARHARYARLLATGGIDPETR